MMKCGIRLLLSALLALVACTTASAQGLNPSRPITIIVPFPPGGATDVVIRAVGQRLSQRLNISVLIENRPGASGATGLRFSARADADGHTLATISGPLVRNEVVLKEPGFHIDRDFIPLASFAAVPTLVVAKADLKIQSMDEFFEYAKAHPGALSIGATSPLLISYLRWATKLDITPIPYRGSAPIVNDVVAGQVDLGLIVHSDVAPHLETGKIRPLFTCSLERIAALPNLPALSERVPGFESVTWFGLALPAKTPQPIVDLLRKELVEIATSADLRQFLTDRHLTPSEAPAELDALIQRERNIWARLVKEGVLPQQ
jgi:tripartite-type tricarboxylate transporter receptor subunit TctC